MSGFQSIRAAYPEQPAQQKPEITDNEFIAYLKSMASLIRKHAQLGDSVLAAKIDSKNQFSIGPNGE